MKKFFYITLLSFLIFFLSGYGAYKLGINSLVIQSEDNLPSMFLPVTLLLEGTFYADSYYDMILQRYPHPNDLNQRKDLTPYYFRKIALNDSARVIKDQSGVTLMDHTPQVLGQDYSYITAFPVITGLLAVPVYAAPLAFGMDVTWENLIILSRISGALVMALSGGLFYILAKRNFSHASLLTFIYLFATINFALLSQAMWQHSTVQLFVIAGLIYFFESIKVSLSYTKRDVFLFFAGLFWAIAFLARPTALLVIVVMLGYKLYISDSALKYTRDLVYVVLGFIPPALFFLWYNSVYFGSILNQGYVDQIDNSWLSNIFEGVLGLWISPNKGILVYSPVLIFIFVSLYLLYKRYGFSIQKFIYERTYYKTFSLYLAFFAIAVGQTMVLGKWKHWYGGWSYGYRMASDVILFMVLLLVPYLQSDFSNKTRKLFIFLLILSVLVQVHGIIFYDGVWHAAYDQGFSDTSWLWSIKDGEFMFNVRRVMVKFGLLEQACPAC